MSKKAKHVARAKEKARSPSSAERIEAQRKQIFKAMGIIEACRLGSDSMLAPLDGAEDADFGDALAAAHDLLCDIAEELETLSAGPGSKKTAP